MKRTEELGPDGLTIEGNELAKAIAVNALPVPTSILTSVLKPHPNSIRFNKVNIYRTGDPGLPIGLDLESWPTYAEVYDCPTKFVYVSCLRCQTRYSKPRKILCLLLDYWDILYAHNSTKSSTLFDFADEANKILADSEF